MEFDTRLRCLIIHLGMTQKQIARDCNVSESKVSRWVHGKSEPSLQELVLLSCSLGYISLNDLIIGNLFLDELLKEKYASKFVEQMRLDI